MGANYTWKKKKYQLPFSITNCLYIEIKCLTVLIAATTYSISHINANVHLEMHVSIYWYIKFNAIYIIYFSIRILQTCITYIYVLSLKEKNKRLSNNTIYVITYMDIFRFILKKKKLAKQKIEWWGCNC